MLVLVTGVKTPYRKGPRGPKTIRIRPAAHAKISVGPLRDTTLAENRGNGRNAIGALYGMPRSFAVSRQPPLLELPASPLPMLGPANLARWLCISRRSLDRLRSQGRLPVPDIHVGKIIRWRVQTVKGASDE